MTVRKDPGSVPPINLPRSERSMDPYWLCPRMLCSTVPSWVGVAGAGMRPGLCTPSLWSLIAPSSSSSLPRLSLVCPLVPQFADPPAGDHCFLVHWTALRLELPRTDTEREIKGVSCDRCTVRVKRARTHKTLTTDTEPHHFEEFFALLAVVGVCGMLLTGTSYTATGLASLSWTRPPADTTTSACSVVLYDHSNVQVLDADEEQSATTRIRHAIVFLPVSPSSALAFWSTLLIREPAACWAH